MIDSESYVRGGEGVIVVGTLIAPEEIPSWVPEQFLKTFLEMKLAIKKLEWGREDAEASTKFFNSFVNELSLMATLNHPNVISLTGFVEDMEKGDAWVIMPWAPNGNVREFLAYGEWDAPERVSLIQDTVNGLEYLHTRQPPICHGDLKSHNILVNASYHAVITDFGSARAKVTVDAAETADVHGEPLRQMNIDDLNQELIFPKIKFEPSTLELTLTGAGYSLRWTAPEVLGYGMGSQDLPSDMWSIGWVCWEIFTGKIPFQEIQFHSVVVSYVIKGKLPAIREEPDLSHVLQLCSLMMDCWMSNPVERIDVSTFQRKVRFMPSITPSVDKTGGSKVRSANLLLELGRMYGLQNNTVMAESHVKSAIEVATQTKDDKTKANALNGLGGVYNARSRYPEAEKAFREAHEIHSRIGNERGAADALSGLGGVYSAQSRYSEAEKAFVEAHEIHSRIGNVLGVGNALISLGETYDAQSRDSEAEKLFIEAHKIHSRIGTCIGTATALIALGNTYDAQSRDSEAEQAYMDALKILSRIDNGPRAINVPNDLEDISDAEPRNIYEIGTTPAISSFDDGTSASHDSESESLLVPSKCYIQV